MEETQQPPGNSYTDSEPTTWVGQWKRNNSNRQNWRPVRWQAPYGRIYEEPKEAVVFINGPKWKVSGQQLYLYLSPNNQKSRQTINTGTLNICLNVSERFNF